MNDVGPEHFRTADGGFCVRIMAAYGSEGVWSAEGREALVDDLPVARELADRLADWQEAFDALEDGLEEGGRTDRTPGSEWTALAEEGLAIARAVKRSLPDWIVLYVDPALAQEAGGTSATEISS